MAIDRLVWTKAAMCGRFVLYDPVSGLSKAFDAVLRRNCPGEGGRPFGIDALRAIQLSKRDVLTSLAEGRKQLTTAEWRDPVALWDAFSGGKVGVGLWAPVFAKLAKDADFEALFIDSTIVRAHQHAAGAPKKKRSSVGAFARRTEY